MPSNEAALKYLNQNKLLYLDMLEILRRGSGELLYAGEDGVLLYDRWGKEHLMSARDRAALDKILEYLPACEVVVGHELWYKEELAKRFGLRQEQICRQAAWLHAELPTVPAFDGQLRLLTQEWAPYVEAHYSHSFGGVAYIEGAIRRGMLGAFVGDTLAGFAGFHVEGAMGMLEVLPQYRRHGLGQALLLGTVRLALERGEYAFGQVFIDKEPSLALQRRAGMAVSEEILYWLF